MRRRLAAILFGASWVTALAWWAADFDRPNGFLLRILALAATFGAVVGVVVVRRTKTSRVRTFAAVVVLHALVVAWSMARAPHLYAASFYAKGGLPRTVQILVTDVLGPIGVCVAALALGIAYFRPSLVRRIARPLRLAFALPLIFGVSCGAKRTSTQPNVLVIAIESLRAGEIGPESTPTISALGSHFERAYATSEATWPALVTGRYAFRAEGESLPSRLRAAGWAVTCIGATADLGCLGADRNVDSLSRSMLLQQSPIMPVLDSPIGAVVFTEMRAVAPDPVADVQTALARAPFFVAVVMPLPERVRLPASSYRGRYKYGTRDVSWDPPSDADDEKQLALLRAARVRAADDVVARLLASIDRERTIVVVTSDRGDATGRIPLVLHDPRRAPRRVGAVVRDVDVAPTIHALTGVAALDVDGESLAAGSIVDRVAVSEGPGDLTPFRKRFVRDGRFTLVHEPSRKGVKVTLFDAETESSDAREMQRLEAELWRFVGRDSTLQRQGDFVVPRAERLVHDVVVVSSERVPERGIVFPHAFPASSSRRAGVDALVGLLPRAFRERGFAAGAIERGAADVESETRRFVHENRERRFFLFVEDISEEALFRAIDPDRTVVVWTRASGEGPVPLALWAPRLRKNGTVRARIRAIDVAPTVRELVGLEPDPKAEGRSFVALARGDEDADERSAVVDVGGVRVFHHGRYRFVARAGAPELYDVDDPKKNVAAGSPEIVAEMRARLDAALARVPVAGSAEARAPDGPRPFWHLRFATAGAARRVSGTIAFDDGKVLRVVPVGLGADAYRAFGTKVSLSFTTLPKAVVGVDLETDPPGARVRWELHLDDAPWPDGAVFAGPHGLPAPHAATGVSEGDPLLLGGALPAIDPARERGFFVVREMATPR